jgi:hypothetical protein
MHLPPKVGCKTKKAIALQMLTLSKNKALYYHWVATESMAAIKDMH